MSTEEDVPEFENWLSMGNKFGRAAWTLVYLTLFFPAYFRFFWPWRRFLLRVFGASVHTKSHVYSSVKIWAPWNLSIGEHSCLASGVNVYNTGQVKIGKYTTISQGAYLCPGSHDISDPKFPMICSDMHIGDRVWIATEAFIGGMGVHIGDGAVVGARAVVTKDVEPWTVVVGNPARPVKKREIKGGLQKDTIAK